MTLTRATFLGFGIFDDIREFTYSSRPLCVNSVGFYNCCLVGTKANVGGWTNTVDKFDPAVHCLDINECLTGEDNCQVCHSPPNPNAKKGFLVPASLVLGSRILGAWVKHGVIGFSIFVGYLFICIATNETMLQSGRWKRKFWMLS